VPNPVLKQADKEIVKAEATLIMLTHGPLRAAEYIARESFGAAKDSGGDLYFNHLERVAMGIPALDVRPAGYLHDLIEDVKDERGQPAWSFEDLYEIGFSATVVEGVRVVTKDDEDPYFDEMVKVGLVPAGRQIKLSDLRDNSNPLRLGGIPTEKHVERTRKYYLAYHYLNDIENGRTEPGTVFAKWMAAQKPEKQNWQMMAKYSIQPFSPPACNYPDPTRPKPRPI
jgi:hypothetical protein